MRRRTDGGLWVSTKYWHCVLHFKHMKTVAHQVPRQDSCVMSAEQHSPSTDCTLMSYGSHVRRNARDHHEIRILGPTWIIDCRFTLHILVSASAQHQLLNAASRHAASQSKRVPSSSRNITFHSHIGPFSSYSLHMQVK